MSKEALHHIDGVNVSVIEAGIRYEDRTDLTLVELAAGTNTAAIFTLNKFCAAPVQVAKQHMQQSMPRFLIINAGNANAGTGKQGMADALKSCELVAQNFSCDANQTLPFSTGVIGELMPMEKFDTALEQISKNAGQHSLLDAAAAIMTTDTCSKLESRSIEIAGKTVNIVGIAKGSGMIKPNMATMLGYVFTDAEIDQARLHSLLLNTADKSFNRITVDGDTSTNDSVTLSATAKSGVQIDDGNRAEFEEALQSVMSSLAQQIVRDGEGATKFVEIVVEDAANKAEALECAYTVAHSPLVKTALFASDPNWGRILAAVGRAPVSDLDVDKVQIFLGDVQIVRDGGVASDYTEEKGAEVMKQRDISIRISLGRGSEQETVWTSDFSYDYVKINAEYRS